jgi:hypothetical protein
MIGAVAISAQSDARNGKVESDAALTIASQSLRVMPRVGQQCRDKTRRTVAAVTGNGLLRIAWPQK